MKALKLLRFGVVYISAAVLKKFVVLEEDWMHYTISTEV